MAQPPDAEIKARPSVDLTNCALEPIHVPGSIQPHGALIALTPTGALAARSTNAESIVGPLPAPGENLGDNHLTAEMRAHLTGCLARAGHADTFELTLPDGRTADLSVHFHDGLLLAEFEPRHAGALAPSKFAVIAQRVLERIQAQQDLDGLLAASVEEISELSGFDRVMAYRFHPDDSGEVVAERMRKPLEPFLGLRYPATDIPAQARLLFIKNPVRLIPDVAYRPIPVEPDRNPRTGRPIDLSLAALRSVSPIHVEYLTNMGVRASMAVSVVVAGRLWGLFACHHYAPLLVNPAVRLTCRLLSQVVSVAVERFVARGLADSMARTQHMRNAIAERVKADESTVRALISGEPALTELVRCAGAAVTTVTQQATLGETPGQDAIAAVVAWLAEREATRFATSHIEMQVPELAAACRGFAGFAAIRFSPEPDCYALWFRREEVETLRWAGNPQKAAVVGPHGDRLSPRGSFAEWKEIVRGQSERWDAEEINALEELRRALFDIAAVRLQETVRTRELLLAMLGHDLRSPLQAIAMAGEVLRVDQSRASQVQKQIASTSGRMGRLITHVLDLSRLQSGVGLVRALDSCDLEALLREIVAETRSSHPGFEVVERYAGIGHARIDADRIAQVLSNLISNARHHGTAGKPIVVEGKRCRDQLLLRVINHGPAISAEALQTLFEPFKRGSLDNPANPRGLGLGLYIASSIVREHGGSLGVESANGLVTFTVALPTAIEGDGARGSPSSEP
jgi:light-regulated signal transduction histidine kinase (bacteriophytochrome)